MAGIAGIAKPGQIEKVNEMLDSISHRGHGGREVLGFQNCTLGVVWPAPGPDAGKLLKKEKVAADQWDDNRYAVVEANGFVLKRDPVGAAPLYYGHTSDGTTCFASEVKSLLHATGEVNEMPPGHTLKDGKMRPFEKISLKPSLKKPREKISTELRQKLHDAVKNQIETDETGSWLSGGLDSSVLAALARPHVGTLHTFSAGLQNAPDLIKARQVANQLDTQHHEIVVKLQDILDILPEVIFHLESFDALLVRSSVMNYLVGKMASYHVGAVFSGEGGDELFAGYEYLKETPEETLATELIDITNQLHNTALQRVDRSSAAHGLRVHTSFLDPEVLDYAHRIPVKYKIRNGVEKYILRQAAAELLPEDILNRPKAKFWEGSGIGDMMAAHAEEHITGKEFEQEMKLPNGWKLNSKEELMYYRIFKEYFGACENLTWMGRTKMVH